MDQSIWKVPLSDISFGQTEYQAVEKVLRSGWLSMGEVTGRFETEWTEYLNCEYAFAVSSGSAALHLACLALEIGPGDEVIVPSLTFVATSNAVLYTGAKPVFADINSLDDLTISPAAIERMITPRTKAIIVMHYGGYLCDMPAILEIANNHGLVVIEDAAHAPGSTLDGKKAGVLGDVGCFSFFANKNLVTGEGGLVVTKRPELAGKIRLLRSHGMTCMTWDRHRGHAQSYDVVRLGYNYRLDEMRSALGLVQLEKLEQNNYYRREIDNRYRLEFSGHTLLKSPFTHLRGYPAYHLSVVLLNRPEDRSSFIDHLRRRGIQTSLHYPPIHLFTYYRQLLGTQPGLLPTTEMASRRLVTLPLFASMLPEQVEMVIQAVNSYNS